MRDRRLGASPRRKDGPVSSGPWRRRDPAKIAEDVEVKQQYETAKEIYEYPEAHWESQIALLPEDRRPMVRRCLRLMKEHNVKSGRG